MNAYPAPNDHCSDCGTEIEPHSGDARCPACFDKHLFSIDAGFLESYRQFGCRSRLMVAESCLRGLVLESPRPSQSAGDDDLRAVRAGDERPRGLFAAFRQRHEAPILKSFLEFKLDPQSAVDFFETVRNMSDPRALCPARPADARHGPADLPAPQQRGRIFRVASPSTTSCRTCARRPTRAKTARWRWPSWPGRSAARSSPTTRSGSKTRRQGLTPDQVALLVFDTRRRNLYVQGLTADEGAMGSVVDAIDTVTRAASNLIYAYLQTQDL